MKEANRREQRAKVKKKMARVEMWDVWDFTEHIKILY